MTGVDSRVLSAVEAQLERWRPCWPAGPIAPARQRGDETVNGEVCDRTPVTGDRVEAAISGLGAVDATIGRPA